MASANTLNGPLIQADSLVERVDDPQVCFLDATWIAPFLDPDTKGRELFDKQHIAHAQFFDIDAIADQSSDLPHMLPTPIEFGQALSELGVRNDQFVVCYDQNNYVASARAWWMMRVMGHERVAVLNGGLKAWLAAGGKTSTGAQSTGNAIPSDYSASFRPELLARLDQVQNDVRQNSRIILDARSQARFSGSAPEPRAGLSSGHMPNALNVPSGEFINEDGLFKSNAELKALFDTIGVDVENGQFITTCGSGVTAAIISLALASLGQDDVALYDGSWSEWGQAADCPFVTD
ncbi:MAG: 3-mercaptopyruvate sulfurtransferase [Hirschia sp.]|nr:3-mercaptopyruvate sulfurtransferase [Hirschia sp.]MBF17222.1 3-mercaptopyruvate sulfurtransferase [Hirschia sp.]|tara:strand:+ start:3324 stop:4199 length:876 start_codon:yes stop_codon:yes gene_type:complete